MAGSHHHGAETQARELKRCLWNSQQEPEGALRKERRVLSPGMSPRIKAFRPEKKPQDGSTLGNTGNGFVQVPFEAWSMGTEFNSLDGKRWKGS